MSEQISDVRDLEAPLPDALEQALAVGDPPGDEAVTIPPVDLLSADFEVPESDAVEQHQPAPLYDDDSWR